MGQDFNFLDLLVVLMSLQHWDDALTVALNVAGLDCLCAKSRPFVTESTARGLLFWKRMSKQTVFTQAFVIVFHTGAFMRARAHI